MAQKARTHKHHIVPKHMGGGDEPENLVVLTVEEHAEAHKKLFEEYGKKEDYIAWKTLDGQISVSEAKKMAQKIGARRGGEVTKQIIAERVLQGTYHLQSGDIQRKTQLTRSAEGIHNFKGMNEKRIAAGTHNRAGRVTCRNTQGIVVAITKEEYAAQKEASNDPSKWEYVFVGSFEAKKRKPL